jgi:hypothetical protein
MLGAKFDKKMKECMWAEAINTATQLENATSKDDSGCAKVKLFEKNYPWIRNLREFGELAVVTVATKIKGKLENRGVLAMFVGYCNNHPSDTYRFINLQTNRLIVSRDYQWLDIVWGDYDMYNLNREEGDFELEDDEWEQVEDIVEADEQFHRDRGIDPMFLEVEGDRQEHFDGVPLEQGGRQTRVERELARLRTFYNPAPYPLPEENNADDQVERMLLTMVQDSRDDEPTTFQEAWHHPDERVREKWRQAIRKEFHDMIVRQVWRVKNRKDVPNTRKLIGSK